MRQMTVSHYDDDDRVELAEEAKVEDYSLLLISMPKIEQDTEFTPDRLQSALQDNDRTEWVFSRLEEQWKQKYYAVAVSPPEHGTGNLCPISFGKYKGKYSARWIDCAHCHFNVAQPPCCLCVAGAGIQKKEEEARAEYTDLDLVIAGTIGREGAAMIATEHADRLEKKICAVLY